MPTGGSLTHAYIHAYNGHDEFWGLHSLAFGFSAIKVAMVHSCCVKGLSVKLDVPIINWVLHMIDVASIMVSKSNSESVGRGS